LSFYYRQIDRGKFKQCVHSDIKTYLDVHKVTSWAEVSTMTDDNALMHIFLLKYKSVPNLIVYVQNRFLSYSHFDKPKSNSSEKNGNSDKPLEINKGWLPKSIPSCSYFKKGHIAYECCWVLKRKNENKPQCSLACTELTDSLMSVEVEKPNSRV